MAPGFGKLVVFVDDDSKMVEWNSVFRTIDKSTWKSALVAETITFV